MSSLAQHVQLEKTTCLSRCSYPE
uniref:Uncharacterized protein n=1 Tax=Anguilla anguilla TaxID=7936 RepID=A0A0E9QH42_ANGAN